LPVSLRVVHAFVRLDECHDLQGAALRPIAAARRRWWLVRREFRSKS
jgi:hypothetical protein